MNITKIWIEDDAVAISYDGGEIVSYELNNGWRTVLAAICNGTLIQVMDKRVNRQEHQKDLSCVVNME